ncbi:MAG: TetR/AcrR family transcriptional regulator [Parashewanella sp.]
MCPAPKYSVEQQAEMILDASVKVIEASSLLDFKMTAIAKEAGLSVGSLYKYVQTKEDVIIALACQYFENLAVFASRIYQMPLSMPQKLMGFLLACPQKSGKFSFDLDLEVLATSEPVLRRCSPMWKVRMLSLTEKMGEICHQKVQDCFDSGEYLGDSFEEIHELSIGNWAMSAGCKQVRCHQKIMGEHGGEQVSHHQQIEQDSLRAMRRFINAYPWKQPLTDEGIEQVKVELIKLGYR